jgi:streptogramin lyase
VRTRRVTATKVGRRPFAVVAAAGGVWVSSYDGQKITRLDPRSGRVVRESRFDGRPYWLEFVRGSLWVGEQEGVSRVDPKSLRLIEHVDVGQDVWQMSVDVEGQLWVAERWGFEVSQIDTRRNKVVQRVRVGLRQPLGVAAEEDVWIADSVKQEVLYARL